MNYDTNIEELTDKPVYHLHGSFTTLHHEYRPETFKGWAILSTGKSLPEYIKAKSYLYCDAVLGFSGNDKIERINQYNGVYDNPLTENFLKKHPELISPKYPIDEFKSIEGELHLIGVCPNNDSHIFQMINDNEKIKRIVYYSACGNDTERIQKILNKSVTVVDVFKYWEKIRGR